MATKQKFEIGNYITWYVIIGHQTSDKKFGIIKNIKDNVLDIEVTSTLLSYGISTSVKIHTLLDHPLTRVNLRVISVNTYKKLVKNMSYLLDHGITELKKYKGKGYEVRRLVLAKNKVTKLLQTL